MKKGAIAKPIPIGEWVPLIAADLERLKEKRYVPSTPQKLRDSHHMIARLHASGLRGFQIAERMGYSAARVNDLLNSPAMEELVAKYREKVDEAFTEQTGEFFEIAMQNMKAAERHISDHFAELDATGELMPVRVALAIASDGKDRFGPSKKSQQTNINVDFASALEKAIARSGKQIEGHGNTNLIEGTPRQPTTSLPASPPLPRSVEQQIPRHPVAPPPLLRRRA